MSVIPSAQIWRKICTINYVLFLCINYWGCVSCLCELFVLFVVVVILLKSSPWYNCTGWLGAKHQVTYLLLKSIYFWWQQQGINSIRRKITINLIKAHDAGDWVCLHIVFWPWNCDCTWSSNKSMEKTRRNKNKKISKIDFCSCTNSPASHHVLCKVLRAF